jgi:hypothetical protein
VIAAKLRKMAAFYHSALVDKGGTGPKRMNVNTYITEEVLKTPLVHDHLVWCCGQVKHYADINETEVGEQWLGFIQGSLWALGYFSIEDLRQHGLGYMLGMDED